MSTDALSLPDDAATLKELAAQQQATIAELRRELEQLQHYAAQLLRARYGPRGEKFDPNQLTLFDASGAVEETCHETEVRETPVAAHVRRRGKRKPLPEDVPREQVEHDLAEEEKACPGCGEVRQRIGSETSEQWEFIPASLKVIEHIRYKYACRRCQEHVAIAPPPSKPIPKGVAGPGLLSALVVGKWSDHLSLYRLEDVFFRHGVEISRGTL